MSAITTPFRRGTLRLSILLLTACHVGAPRSSIPSGGYRVLPVLAPVADSYLPELLRREVGASLAARGMLGQEQSLEIEVLDSGSEATAVGPASRAERARLVLRVRLLGPAPAQVILQAQRPYQHPTDLGFAAAEQRRQAHEALSTELAQQIADWLVVNSTEGTPL